MNTTLTQLVGEWQQVTEMLMDPEMDEQTVLDTLESIEGAIEVKADGYGAVIRNLEMEKAAISGRKEYVKTILEQLDGMEKHIDHGINRMKDHFKEAMIAIGKDEEGIKTDNFIFKIKKAGGKQKLEKTGEVPQNFKEIIYKDNDDKIREYLKDHDCEWARLLPRTSYLDIKGV